MPDWCFPTVGGTQDVFFDRAAARALPTIVAGDGIYLVDDRGRRLLDACSGPFLAALGQGNERVLRAMLEQGRTLTYTYSRTTRHHANAALTERLASLAGAGFERAHLTSGGSEAVEVALKFLRAHAVATGQAQRHRVISLMPGYHGATLQTLGLNGDLHAPELWGPMAVLSDKIPAPLTFRAASPETAAGASLAALEQAIERLGPSFASGARTICDRHGIRLVFDESVSALRTGHFLAAHHAPDALPDVAVLAKGLAAGYAPLGAALMSAQLVEELAVTTGFVVAHSYDANPIACAAGAAVLDEIVERDLIAHAERIGTRLRAGLERIAAHSPLIGDVRGRGLLLAIELVADRDTLARFPAHVDPGAVVLRHGLDHGLLLYSRRQNSGHFGDWLLIAPPLVIDPQACDDLLSSLELTLAAAAGDLLSNHAIR
jgi:adenosylmethionine-8-amino-7-oxononanoate aminotransferase